MKQTRRNKATGLDIGQTGARVVCLARSGRKVVVKRAEAFCFREEGLLGDADQETFAAIGSWLKEHKLQGQRMVLGLPQYMATTQLNDFVKGIKGEELERMVGYETTQLAGISDDSFLHDYAILPAGQGRVNPVLIGICREASVDDFTGKAVEMPIALEDVAMNGLAMVNAFAQLQPEAARSNDGVQVLLDVGTETTTVAVVCAGQVLYIGSMMFGGVNVTKEIATQLQLTQEEAERRKLNGEVDWAELNLAAMNLDGVADGLLSEPYDDIPGEAPVEMEEEPEPPSRRLKLSFVKKDAAFADDEELAERPLGLTLPKLPDDPSEEPEDVLPLAEESMEEDGDGAAIWEDQAENRENELGGLGCFRTLVRELAGSLEHWRSSEKEELSSQKVTHVWLCGGGASLEMVQSYLSISQGCEVTVFGPELAGREGPAPEYVIAYGLALQGLGSVAVPISLAPRALAWMLQKERRAKFVVAAFLLLLFGILGWLYFDYTSQQKAIEDLSEKTALLQANVKKLTKLDSMKREYQATLMQVLPVVSGHARTQAYLTALEELQQSVKSPMLKDCTNWCVYVADEDSFLEYNETATATTAAAAMPLTPRRRGSGRTLETVETAQTEQQQAWQATLTAEAKVTDMVSVKPLRNMYVVGMVVSSHDNHNVIEREIMLQLEHRQEDGRPSGTSLFGEVQVMTEEERKRCSKRALEDWERVFKHLMTNEVFRKYRGGYKPFYLRLGYRTQTVSPPAENPFAEKKSKKKGRKK